MRWTQLVRSEWWLRVRLGNRWHDTGTIAGPAIDTEGLSMSGTGSSIWGSGFHFGHAAGYSEGVTKGLAEGLETGRAEGFVDGLRSGRVQGFIGGALLTLAVVEGGRRYYQWKQRKLDDQLAGVTSETALPAQQDQISQAGEAQDHSSR
jgi:hypothetical protein